MKHPVLITVLVLGLFATAARADVAREESDPAVLGAELAFGAASCVLGVTNIGLGYQGERHLVASLLGLGVGVTSLVLSTQQDAEIPVLDFVVGTVSIVGALCRVPRRSAQELVGGDRGSKRGLVPRTGVELGCRRVAFRVRF